MQEDKKNEILYSFAPKITRVCRILTERQTTTVRLYCTADHSIYLVNRSSLFLCILISKWVYRTSIQGMDNQKSFIFKKIR